MVRRNTFSICLFFVGVLCTAFVCGDSDDEVNGGWNGDYDAFLLDTARCNIPKKESSSLSAEEFHTQYFERYPVILLGATNITAMRRQTTRRHVIASFGDQMVTLSSADRQSSKKTRVSFRYYVEQWMRRQRGSSAADVDDSRWWTSENTHSGCATNGTSAGDIETEGSDVFPHRDDCKKGGEKEGAPEPWYLFGDTDSSVWGDLFTAVYEPPPRRFRFSSHLEFSFGIGRNATGIPFHTHGGVFAEVIYGRKRWWLQEPSTAPRVSGAKASTLEYLRNVYPTLSFEERARLLECVLGPGEMLYLPSHWHHATLNLGETVFVSGFA